MDINNTKTPDHNPLSVGDDSSSLVLRAFNPSDIDIVAEPKSLDSLINRIKHDEIDMNTDFQRNADLWDDEKMSRLIESILIRLPIPPFYFDASDDNNWLIIDGLQRLSSIRKFVIEDKLKLTDLEFLTDLQGQTFNQLHRSYQRRINEALVTIYMIKPGTPPDVKYSIFRRINTGGLILNDQEIRNALSKAEDRELLKKLASSGIMKNMMGDLYLSERMKGQELVLRFWAFYHFNYLENANKINLTHFLDKVMDDLKQGNKSYRKDMSEIFHKTIDRCKKMLGEKGFENQPTFLFRLYLYNIPILSPILLLSMAMSNPKKLIELVLSHVRNNQKAVLFELWMSTLAKLSDSDYLKLKSNKKEFIEKYEVLKRNKEFRKSISKNAYTRDHIEIRYKKINNLIGEIIND